MGERFVLAGGELTDPFPFWYLFDGDVVVTLGENVALMVRGDLVPEVARMLTEAAAFLKSQQE